jgi:hypothetical protein
MSCCLKGDNLTVKRGPNPDPHHLPPVKEEVRERDEAETEWKWEREAKVGGGSDAEQIWRLGIARRGESNCILQ